MFTEGVSISARIIPPSLVGKTLAEAGLENQQGYTVLALQRGPERIILPQPETELLADDRIILIGTDEEEQEFWDVAIIE